MLFERRVAFIKKSRAWLLLIALGYIAVVGTMTPFLLGVGSFWVGAFLGSTCTGLAWLVMWFVGLDDSYYPRHGAWAEEWTAKLLRKNLPHWTVMNDVPMNGRNVDHVLVGPGGIYAVETKWRATRGRGFIAVDAHSLEPELRQAKRQADEVNHVLREKGCSPTAQPVLILWGPGFSSEEAPFIQFGRVRTLIGSRSADWPARALDRYSLPSSEVSEAVTILKHHLRNSSSSSLEPSLVRKAFRIAKAMVHRQEQVRSDAAGL